MYYTVATGAPDYEGEKAVRVAQATVASLQQRLEKKDETIARLEQLLKGAREDAERAGKQHVQELSRLQQRLGSQTSDAYQRFKGITVELLGQHQQTTQLHNKQVLLATSIRTLQYSIFVQHEYLCRTYAARTFERARGPAGRAEQRDGPSDRRAETRAPGDGGVEGQLRDASARGSSREGPVCALMYCASNV